MNFTRIDIDTWNRREYFEHYFSSIPCTYSMTVKLDITPLIRAGRKLYPAMLYILASVVNRHDEFRTAFNDKGELGIYDSLLPCYTIFHKDSETFSNLWTEYSEDYDTFFAAFQQDMQQYKDVKGMLAKPELPPNNFPVSMIPWTSFEGFNLNLQKGYEYLLPIFTMGKYQKEADRILLPLAIQVHHAVCDGFHISRLIREAQDMICNGF